MNRMLIAISIIAVCATAITTAQEPETVEKWAKRQMSHEWYLEQQQLWKNEVERNRGNADAWYNYFKATRYAGFGDTLADGQEKQRRMQEVLDEMGKAVPDAYQYHYAMWWAGGNNIDLFPELEKAYQIQPDYPMMAESFMTYYELTGDSNQVKFFARKWYQSHDMSPALLEYSYNVLASLEPNAVLITSGDNDTYPFWLLQYAKGIRTDVTIMNVSLISVQDYRERIMEQQHIKGDPSLLDWKRLAETPYETCVAEYVKSVAERNDLRPVYAALTVSPEYLSLIKEDLYTVGLANRYSNKRFDNIAVLKHNWERFRFDYLDESFYTETYVFNTSLLPQLNMNYILPAMLLYEHYHIAGEADKAETFKAFALNIAHAGGQELEVEKYLKDLNSDEGNSRPASQTVVLKSSHEAEEDAFVKTFPNPARTTLTVKLTEAMDAEMELVSLDGIVMKTARLRNGSISLNVEDVAAGNYVLNVKTLGRVITRTIQIAR